MWQDGAKIGKIPVHEILNEQIIQFFKKQCTTQPCWQQTVQDERIQQQPAGFSKKKCSCTDDIYCLFALLCTCSHNNKLTNILLAPSVLNLSCTRWINPIALASLIYTMSKTILGIEAFKNGESNLEEIKYLLVQYYIDNNTHMISKSGLYMYIYL